MATVEMLNRSKTNGHRMNGPPQRMNGHVPFHVAEELRRWNKHLEKHQQKINDARTTIEKKKMKASGMKDQLQRNSQYQSQQRAIGIEHDNQLLLKRLNRIGSRGESISRNMKYYDKQRSGSHCSARTTSSVDVMKSVREKEKKSITDEKNRLESKIIKEKKQRNKQQQQQQQQQKQQQQQQQGWNDDVDGIRPNVLPVKLEKDRNKTPKTPSSQHKRGKMKTPGEGEKKTGVTKRLKSKKSEEAKENKKKEKKEKKKDETNAVVEDEEDIDREIDRIIVHSTYDDDNGDGDNNFQIDVIGRNKSDENDDKSSKDVDDVIDDFLNNLGDDGDDSNDDVKKSSPIPPIIIPTSDVIDESDVIETDRTNDTTRSDKPKGISKKKDEKISSESEDSSSKEVRRKSSGGSSTSEASSVAVSNDSSDSD